jgi:DUF4097 and DUF4098 domain-containing protein YvlB
MIAALLLATAAASAAKGDLAAGTGSATAHVAGPVKLELRAYAAEVEIVAAEGPRIAISLADKSVHVALSISGERVEAQFGGKRQLRQGKARIELPRGSSVDLSSVSGLVSISGVGGEVRVRGMSGRVEVSGATLVDVETIDGAVRVAASPGPLRIHTISGAMTIESASASMQAEIETSAGPLAFRGPCAKGCHLDVDSVSGAVSFALDKSSSFALDFDSHSGKLKDELGLAKGASERRGDDDWRELTYGGGEGAIECETFSADVSVTGR